MNYLVVNNSESLLHGLLQQILRDEYNTSYLIISHDMGVIETIADRLAIMYLGKIVEAGPIEDVLEPPFHPYTRSLLTSIPSLDPKSDDKRIDLDGDVPSPRSPPDGCYFHTRCPQKIGEVCETDAPELEAHNGEASHCIACHLDDEAMSIPIETPEKDL
jgi:peptide/nickel transport system ATP-binding protein